MNGLLSISHRRGLVAAEIMGSLLQLLQRVLHLLDRFNDTRVRGPFRLNRQFWGRRRDHGLGDQRKPEDQTSCNNFVD
jgi:hypothetical protein